MNKLNKIKLVTFLGIVIFASITYVYHIIPYKAVWLWFPAFVFVNYWLNAYAKKRGMILSDEMTEQTIGRAAWETFQATIAFIFLLIVYYDYNRVSIDPRFILAYVAGFMGISFLLVTMYYNIKSGAWD